MEQQELPVVRALELGWNGTQAEAARPPADARAAIELPPGPRLSPVSLAILAGLAGVAAMTLGALAVVMAGEPGSTPAPTSPTQEQAILSLLSKPSTERIPFLPSGGRLILAVGSGGRAGLVLRGLGPPTAAGVYHAWVRVPSGAPERAAIFTGTERAVSLSAPVPPGARVEITIEPSEGAAAPAGQLVFVAGRDPS